MLPDDQVLAAATDAGFIVVSHDSNTMTAAANDRIRRGQPLSGLVVVAQSFSVRRAIDGLVLLWAASEHEEWRDRVVFLSSLA